MDWNVGAAPRLTHFFKGGLEMLPEKQHTNFVRLQVTQKFLYFSMSERAMVTSHNFNTISTNTNTTTNSKYKLRQNTKIKQSICNLQRLRLLLLLSLLFIFLVFDHNFCLFLVFSAHTLFWLHHFETTVQLYL